jgi:hypothetical protein
MAVRVFVAGGTGVVGRRLVPQPVARGHQVTATTTTAAKLGLLATLGAHGVVMDGLDAAAVGEAVAAARPDAIVHEMTALSEAHATLARSIIGAEKVARVLASIFRWLVRIDVTLEHREVNGQPGAIFRDRDGRVLAAMTLDILDGQIQAIRSLNNPDKLRHVGPAADAWATAREMNRARRPPN